MKTGKIQLALFVFLVLLTMINSVKAAPMVSVSGFDTSGSINTDSNRIKLSLDLLNRGDSCAYSVTISTNSIFLSNKDSDNGPRDVCGRETFDIILDIPPNIVAGTYPIAISGMYTDANNSRQYTFSSSINLFIDGSSDIRAHIISSSPLNVYPGDTATISVLIENDGTLQAQSVRGVLSAKEPIEIKQAESFFSVGSLLPKQTWR